MYQCMPFIGVSKYVRNTIIAFQIKIKYIQEGIVGELVGRRLVYTAAVGASQQPWQRFAQKTYINLAAHRILPQADSMSNVPPSASLPRGHRSGWHREINIG
jgi:hypothetical protein